MLFITVTALLCGTGVEDPSEFRSGRHTAGRMPLSVFAIPASIPPRNGSVQAKTSRSYTAPTLLWKRIGDKSGISHRFSCFDCSTVEFTAGVGKGRITAHTVYLQCEFIVQMACLWNTGYCHTNTAIFSWGHQSDREFMSLRCCVVPVIPLNIISGHSE